MRASLALALLGGIVLGCVSCESRPAAQPPVPAKAMSSSSPGPAVTASPQDAGAMARDARTARVENPDPENPDPENPDPESRDPESRDPESRDPESPDPGTLVDLRDLLPEVALDMRYAGSNNFVGKAIYPKARCLVRSQVARALAVVQAALAKENLQLLLWDCYRPFSVQEDFWKLVPDPRYVAKPLRQAGKLVKGSKHNRGAAVDLTMATRSGQPVTMPTDHDDFTARAHVDAKGIPPKASKNARKLRKHMEAAGFTGIASEWWHFDHQSWRQYDLSDQPL